MTFEQELNRVRDLYADQGFQVTLRPRPEDLPAFARDFKVEILGKRADKGVLVAVKRNRDEVASDSNMPRYAEVTGAQPGWRFDFAILEGEDPTGRRGVEAREFSEDDINKAIAEAEQMVRLGFVRPAIITAWAGLEAAMRARLRASGEDTAGTTPRVLINELYSSGMLSASEFHQLESTYRLRNEIVHGFSSPTPDPKLVQILGEITRRLVVESQQIEQPV